MSNLQIGRGIKTRAKRKTLKHVNTIKKIKKDKKPVGYNSKEDDYQGSRLEPFETLEPLFLEKELNIRTFPYEHRHSNEENEDNEKDVAVFSDDAIYEFDGPVDQEDEDLDEENEEIYKEEEDNDEDDDEDLDYLMDDEDLDEELENFFGGTNNYNQNQLLQGTGIIKSLKKNYHRDTLSNGKPHYGDTSNYVTGIILQDNNMGAIHYVVDGRPAEKLKRNMRVKFNITPTDSGIGARNVIPIGADNVMSDPPSSSTTSSLSSLPSDRSSSRRVRHRENVLHKKAQQDRMIQSLMYELQKRNYELQKQTVDFQTIYQQFQQKDIEIYNLHNELHQKEMMLHHGPKQYCHNQKGIFLKFEDDGEVGNRIGYIRELDGQSKFMVHEYDLIHNNNNNNNNKFDLKPGAHVTYSIEHHGYIGPTKAMFVKPRGERTENEDIPPTHELPAVPQKRELEVNGLNLTIDESDFDDKHAKVSVNE